MAVQLEQVVLVDQSGAAVGLADKASVHHRQTPLHLAFSCYVVNARAELLVTRRAWSKKTWPGAWTNTCCGHPMPDEEMPRAIRRRLTDELGLTVGAIDLILPEFRYRAVMTNGVTENEVCPVFLARFEVGTLAPNPDEVAEVHWIPWHLFVRSIADGSLTVSPWCEVQVTHLAELGPDPLRWPVEPLDRLPPAARPRE